MARPRYENSRPITDKMYRAVSEYFLNGNDKQAALIAAGYSLATAGQQAKQVFDHPGVQAEVTRRNAMHAKKADLTAEWVIAEFMKLATAREKLSKFKRVTKDGALDWDFTGATAEELALVGTLHTEFYVEGRGDIAKTIKKFKIDITDPVAVLAHLARIQGMFQDKLKLEGDEEVVAQLQAGRNRIKRLSDETDQPRTNGHTTKL